MIGSDADFNTCPIEDAGSLKALIPNLLLAARVHAWTDNRRKTAGCYMFSNVNPIRAMNYNNPDIVLLGNTDRCTDIIRTVSVNMQRYFFPSEP